MADENHKDDRLKNAMSNFADGMKRDSKQRLRSLAWGAINDAWDMLTNNVKRSASTYIFPDGTGPKEGYGAGRRYDYGDNYRDYGSYARPYREVERDRIGNRSATDIKAVTALTPEKADWIIENIIRKIDTSSINACRVGDLYEMASPKIAPSTTDWKYGWIDKDKGQFSKRIISGGPHAGEYLIVVPEPHLL